MPFFGVPFFGVPLFGVAAVFIDLIISPAANTDRQNKAETEST